MMTTAEIVMDTQGRPILLVPKGLSEGQTVLTISDSGFEIAVDGKPEVRLDNIADEFLMTLGLQNKVGIAVKGEGDEMPDEIVYVADVKLNVTEETK